MDQQTVETAKAKLDAAIAEMFDALGQEGLLSGWLLVYHIATDSGTQIENEYDWLTSRDLPYHAALGLVQLADEMVRTSPAPADCRNLDEDD